ncbi:TPA: hypothetical protein QDB28_004016 [Burkholderia vietnamiensis]|nr:hypothetical protein [Burkholderia vietnamiensis]
MSANYKIAVDLSGVLAALDQKALQLLGAVAETVQATAEATSGQWKNAVMKAPLYQGDKAAYVNSINWFSVNQFEAIVESDWDRAALIETGQPARDLKNALKTSLKVRIVQKGKHAGQRYLIIPFRHNTPGNDALAAAMPDDVYAFAVQLKQSRITGQRLVPNQQGASVGGKPLLIKRNTYKWGGALPAGLGPKLKPHHKTDPYAGMVRMKTNAMGSATSSAYLTFRVMGEWSNGWIVPPKPGMYIARGVAAKMQVKFDEAIGMALKSAAGA